MGVEIVLFNAEWRRKFSSFIKVIYTKHDVTLVSNAFNNISFGIHKIASDVSRATLLVSLSAQFVLDDNNVTFIIPIPVTKHVINVKIPLVRIRGAEQRCRC